MKPFPRIAVSVALLAAAASYQSASAAEANDPGRATYLRYCGACHGPNGKGDGIAGTFMNPKPADLTQIARKNGGTFPFQATMAYIDGARDVRAHGDPDMPVWGEVFREQSAWPIGQRAEVAGKLLLITTYVRELQAQ